jgi:hypothetical protein
VTLFVACATLLDSFLFSACSSHRSVRKRCRPPRPSQQQRAQMQTAFVQMQLRLLKRPLLLRRLMLYASPMRLQRSGLVRRILLHALCSCRVVHFIVTYRYCHKSPGAEADAAAAQVAEDRAAAERTLARARAKMESLHKQVCCLHM